MLLQAGAVVTTAPCGESEDRRAPSLPNGWASPSVLGNTVSRPRIDQVMSNSLCQNEKQTPQCSAHEKCGLTLDPALYLALDPPCPLPVLAQHGALLLDLEPAQDYGARSSRSYLPEEQHFRASRAHCITGDTRVFLSVWSNHYGPTRMLRTAQSHVAKEPANHGGKAA